MGTISPKLVVVLGLPGTGKTTFARALSQELGWMHLNTDVIRANLGMREQYDEKTKTFIYQKMLEHAETIVEQRNGLVLDGTFYRETLRDSVRELAGRHGVPIKWIELSAAEDTVRSRVIKKRPFSEADFQVYRKIREVFDPLHEPRLRVYSDKEELSSLIKKAVAFIDR
jgi:predicted kinase